MTGKSFTNNLIGFFICYDIIELKTHPLKINVKKGLLNQFGQGVVLSS